MHLCTDDFKHQSSLYSSVLQPSWPLVLPPALAPSSHQIARPSLTFNPLSSPLSSPPPKSPSFITLNKEVLCPFPSQGIPAALRGPSSHNDNVFSAKRTAGNRWFPPLRGIQLPEHFPFSTLGVGGTLRYPLAQSLPDHVPGSSFTSYAGHRCPVERVRSNVFGKYTALKRSRPPLTAAPSDTILPSREDSDRACATLCHQPHVSTEHWKRGW